MIIPGKIPYIKKARLNIEISAGVMIDQEKWIPATDHDIFFGDSYAKPYDSLTVSITLDGNLLLESNVNSLVKLNHEFTDSEETTSRCLKIIVKGFDEKFCCYVDGIGEVSPMIKIDSFQIENLNMMLTMEDSGKCFYDDSPTDESVPSMVIGQNGFQVLEFTTPIYPWLLANERKPEYYYL
jgi:hypothetical protein